MNELDQTLFLLLNAPTEDMTLIAWLAYGMAKFVVLVIPIHLLLLWFSGWGRLRRDAVAIFIALILGITASYLIGHVFPTQRPFLIPIGNHLIEHRPSAAFPSNHCLVMSLYALSLLYLRYRRMAVFAGIAAAATAWSRVYLGVHFPFDMLGALLLALTVVPLAFYVDDLFGQRIKAVGDFVSGNRKN